MKDLSTCLTHSLKYFLIFSILAFGTLSPFIVMNNGLGTEELKTRGGIGNLYGNEAILKKFYSLLSVPSETTQPIEKQVNAILAKNWETTPAIPSVDSKKSPRLLFTEQIAVLHSVIPDLKWKPLNIIKAKNRYTVIGRATGTPSRSLFGVQPSGKSFSMLTLDVHTVANGKIKKSYHAEDWLNAIKQISSP